MASEFWAQRKIGIRGMEFLERLMETPGIPGREALIREVIHSQIVDAGLFDEIRTDGLGTLIARRSPRGETVVSDGKRPRRILLAAHMDQIGFLVAHIDESGFLYLHPVGAFDPRTLYAVSVKVITEAGETLSGVLNAKGRPLHTAQDDELTKIARLEDFYVDLGMPASEIKYRVRKGDMVVLDGALRQVGDFVAGVALDNRVGCWALIRAMEELESHDCEIICAWTAQEELGSRGAGPLAFSVDPDIGVACDTTVCADVPGVPVEKHVTKAGMGVALQIADSSVLSDMSLVASVEAVAAKEGIACQRALMLGGGQDGALIQRARKGIPVVVFSCPVKYMHTGTEMVFRKDLESWPVLLAKWLATL